MNIWLINHYAVPPQYYPLARQANFAKYLMKMGHTVTIFAASTVHNSNVNLINGKQKWRDDYVDGVHYVYVRCRGYAGNGVSRILNMCEFAWKLPEVCRHYERPDAIVATSMPPMSCAVGIHLAGKYKVKGIAEIADLWPESLIAYEMAGARNPAVLLLRRLEKWIYKKADAIVFTMEGAYDYIVEQGWEKAVPRSKVHFINNGVDLDVFDYNRGHYQIEDSDLDNPDIFKVVYTGSIRKVNDLGTLLDAAKQVNEPNVKFLIWGDGDELPMLRQRMSDEGITNVVFKGRVEKKYIPYIVSRADLNLAHNSSSPILRYGVSFNKLFDYFAAGKPVLCDFASSYNPAIMMNAGVEVKDASCQSIAQAVEQLAASDRKTYEAFCENARNAAEVYSFENLTKDLLEVIALLQET